MFLLPCSCFLLQGKPFPLQEADPGFDTGDYVLNHAAKILRLLYIHNLRDLQTCINECIVAVQNVTANPKTDTKLGKVGKWNYCISIFVCLKCNTESNCVVIIVYLEANIIGDLQSVVFQDARELPYGWPSRESKWKTPKPAVTGIKQNTLSHTCFQKIKNGLALKWESSIATILCGGHGVEVMLCQVHTVIPQYTCSWFMSSCHSRWIKWNKGAGHHGNYIFVIVPNICGSLVLSTLLYIPILPPRILEWLLDFWKISAPII
jgi:hypothetical protein